MRKILYWVLTAVLTLVLVLNVSHLIVIQMDYHQGAEDYAQAEELAGMTDLPITPAETGAAEMANDLTDEILSALAEMDLSALREINMDVIGWIYIPGTDLSYPLLQGRDNAYYLNHTWKQKRNAIGAVFLDYRSSLADHYALIYAHRTTNAAMFGTLKFYEDEVFWKEHPSVYLASEDIVGRYDIFAAFEASVSSDVYNRNLPEDEQESFLSWCMEQSVIDTGLSLKAADRIICLSTCTRSGEDTTRWVVLAALANTLPIPGSVPYP